METTPELSFAQAVKSSGEHPPDADRLFAQREQFASGTRNANLAHGERARPPIPETREAAEAARPWFQQRTIDAYRKYARAKAELTQCRGELAVVESVARGEFDKNEPDYATGSCGSWRVG